MDTHQQAIVRNDKKAEALNLRRQGHQYNWIAGELGISEVTARNYVVEGMKSAIEEPAEEVLKIELSRLDAMYVAISHDIDEGNLVAIDRGLKIMDRRAKFLGLDKGSSGGSGVGIENVHITINTIPSDAKIEPVCVIEGCVEELVDGGTQS